MSTRRRTSLSPVPPPLPITQPWNAPSPSPSPILASGVAPPVTLVGAAPAPARKNSRKKAPAKSTRPVSRKPRLLWVGDAVVPTGFATVTHSVLQHLQKSWDVVVSGVNYDGGAHGCPYLILPACQGGDMWGMNRFATLCAEQAPDVVIINSDWWHVASFLDRAPQGLPIVAYMPVDGAHLNPADMARLNHLAAAAWYTGFGLREAVAAGFKGTSEVIPHGLDATLWQPLEKHAARRALGLHVPDNAFIVGNVNRNQPRKRLDVTIEHFAAWVRQKGVSDAWLLLHCAQQDSGWDLRRVAGYYGVEDRLLLTGPARLREAADAIHLRNVYNALDVQVSTTLGEGWGLTTMEGMACGVPQIVPDWAGLGEWAVPALKVPCGTRLVHPEINTVGALPDQVPFIAQLDRLHRDATLRLSLSETGVAFVHQRKFRWSTIASSFDSLLQRVLPATASLTAPADRGLRAAAA